MRATGNQTSLAPPPRRPTQLRNSQPREPWGSPAPISDGSLSLGWPPRGRYPIPYWEGIKVLSVRYPEIPGGRGGEAKIGAARSAGPDRRASTRFTARGRGGGICYGTPQRNGGASEGFSAGLARGSGLASRLATGPGFPTRRFSVVREHGTPLLDEIYRSVGPRRES